MTDEGVVKYQLRYRLSGALLEHDYSHLNHWHQRFKEEKILGRDPARYGGLGFGNLSERIDQHSFLISGTQTGGFDRLAPQHYALVTGVNLANNRVEACGPVKPSSESLTHAAVYSIGEHIQYVFHVHSPDIWLARDKLNIAQTAADIVYGTPEMAKEIFRLSSESAFIKGNILAMSGHQDGVIGFGERAEDAGNIIIEKMRIARENN